MKKTFDINLAGYQFVIDEDAYDMLKEYLATIRHAFEPGDGAELADDIECRIAEVLQEEAACSGRRIVTIEQVEKIIKRMGSPEEITGVSEAPGETAAPSGADVAYPEPPVYDAPRARRRLYRDGRDKMIGGVCSGAAAYLGIDPTWVRLAMVALCFLSLSTVGVVYLILWIVVPEATTPLEIMEMKGESPTLKNIGTNVADVSGGNNTARDRSFPAVLSRIFGFIGMIIVIGMAVVAVPILLALGIALVCGIGVLIVNLLVGGVSWLDGLGVDLSWMSPGLENIIVPMIICYILVIGIPLFLLVRTIVAGLSKSKSRMNRTWGIALGVTWTVAFVLAVLTTYVTAAEGERNVKRITTYDEVTAVADSISVAADSLSVRAEEVISGTDE